jgi:folate-binding protein YgfZ
LATLLSHLDHFVIMDDVELTDVSHQWTALSLAGPNASRVLATLGVVPTASGSDNATMNPVRIGEIECVLVVARQISVPRFEVWCSPEQVHGLWETLNAAGAQPCGLEATEALRVLEATPLYGVDLNDRDLPQETGQTQALCFSKGCYLGQEIVERIRSRGKVNRQFRQFVLHGSVPAALPADLQSGGQAMGRITSVATVMHGDALTNFALGFARLEVLERDAEISYEGGVATAVAGPPVLSKPVNTSK